MIDEVIEYYYSLIPRRFPVIERLAIHQPVEDDLPKTTLDLVLRARDSSNTARLVLSFCDVRSLQLQPSVQPLELDALQIVSLQDRQWEWINYQVHNAEQDVDFSFFCSSFEVTLNKDHPIEW